MAELYGTLNSAYCSGTPISASKVKNSRTYFYWERYLGSSKWFDRLSAILRDTKKDHNSLSLTAGKDFPEWIPEEEDADGGNADGGNADGGNADEDNADGQNTGK